MCVFDTAALSVHVVMLKLPWPDRGSSSCKICFFLLYFFKINNKWDKNTQKTKPLLYFSSLTWSLRSCTDICTRFILSPKVCFVFLFFPLAFFFHTLLTSPLAPAQWWVYQANWHCQGWLANGTPYKKVLEHSPRDFGSSCGQIQIQAILIAFLQ